MGWDVFFCSCDELNRVELVFLKDRIREAHVLSVLKSGAGGVAGICCCDRPPIRQYPCCLLPVVCSAKYGQLLWMDEGSLKNPQIYAFSVYIILVVVVVVVRIFRPSLQPPRTAELARGPCARRSELSLGGRHGATEAFSCFDWMELPGRSDSVALSHANATLSVIGVELS